MKLLQVIGLNGRISFTQEKGRKLAIAGETGSGKSTLLKMIAGLAAVGPGEVRFEGSRVLGPLERLVPGQPGIAYLSQHFELWNNYRVEEVLSYANDLSVEESVELYGICHIDHLLARRTDQLSGGERQRIALARLLVKPPRLLLLDEPFSNLDMIHKDILKSVIRDITQRLDITCLLVSHDPLDVLSWADEVLVVDSESTDNTREIAAESGAKVIVQPWLGFARQKQLAADSASNDWIFSLDADERVSTELADSIREVTSKDSALVSDGYRIPRRSFYMGRWIKAGGWYPDYQLRLFNRAHGSWKGAYVHESFAMSPDSIVKTLSGDILHFSVSSSPTRTQRLNHLPGAFSSPDLHFLL